MALVPLDTFPAPLLLLDCTKVAGAIGEGLAEGQPFFSGNPARIRSALGGVHLLEASGEARGLLGLPASGPLGDIELASTRTIASGMELVGRLLDELLLRSLEPGRGASFHLDGDLLERRMRLHVAPVSGRPGDLSRIYLRLEEGGSLERAERAEREAEQAWRQRTLDQAEKEALLQELYHRTKNSLQLVNAMLELKKAEACQDGLSLAFSSIAAKVLSIALVQELLYQTQDFSSVELCAYLIALALRILDEHAPFVRLSSSGCSSIIRVPLDIAIPCGIVVGELVFNAAVHGFAGRASGELHLLARRLEDGRIAFGVLDDGRGVEPGFDPSGSGGIGLKLISGIAESQLGGAVRYGSNGTGFSCTIEFTEKDYRPRIDASRI